MAVLTSSRRRFVEQHGHPFYLPPNFVTVATAHLLMSARQREGRALFMIKPRGFPARRIVTSGTIGSILTGCKLSCVWVLVAREALLRRRVKINILQGSFKRRRAMTIAAGNTTVRAN